MVQATRPRLKIHETMAATGELDGVYLEVDAETLYLVDATTVRALPAGAVHAAMMRFGAPLEPGSALVDVGDVALPEGGRLRHVRHLARFDVIARDWLVYETEGSEPWCALATTIAGALDHLARARASEPLSGS